MTTTYPVPGEFPDFEHFMTDLFTPVATTVSTLPTGLTQSQLPLIWVRKSGGSLDANAITYIAQVQVVVFGIDRPTAQQLVLQVRDLMLGAPSTSTNGVLVDYVDEISPAETKFTAPALRRSRGLTDFPDLDPLNQMVELAFTVQARRQ